jgi:hypothetical protein
MTRSHPERSACLFSLRQVRGQDAYRMKRESMADIKMDNRTFQPTGLTAYSTDHGTLVLAIADGESFVAARNELQNRWYDGCAGRDRKDGDIARSCET